MSTHYLLWIVLLLAGLAGAQQPAVTQGYSVRAVDETTGKPLKGILIILRYDCTSVGSGSNIKFHCKFLKRKTDPDGIASFPEAGKLPDIDDIFPISISCSEGCCDISTPNIPGTGQIT